MTVRMVRYAASVATAAVLMMSTASAYAADARCMSTEEAEAFRLRDLQSQLMVAALSCNQAAAYDTFVEHFRPFLASAGKRLITYFHRVGAGDAGLDRHMTALANDAGLSRAEAPEQYCRETWSMFLRLEEDSLALMALAADRVSQRVLLPHECDKAAEASTKQAVRLPTPVAAKVAPAAPVAGTP